MWPEAALISSLILATTQLIPTTQACGPVPVSNSSYNPFEFPKSCDPRPGFTGYGINHFGLIVNDLNATIDFYTQAIGLSLLFIFTPEGAPFFKIAYMGHNNDTANTGKPFATCEEFTLQKNDIKGLIEFLYLDNATYTPRASTKVTNTFSHIGLIVPNVTETQEKMKKLKVPILKPLGELPATSGPLANAFGLGKLSTGNFCEEQKEALVQGLIPSGTLQHLMVTDPDGNVIEIQQLITE
ncbi:uncharacterized protein Z518_05348 [Rhinocladiella mackenziei CBS 650.93]|uniref:VOC domain-containing protein n=1 Tax=Rhinocladiella mackenziei CBS 650.93 TaxID=1442369 RepID=A0A0D2H247_9EURO|nr:uncharacterized protein Z518_05348 [Rhinocladiella mackenziei CBS 650.93]KIX04478.1 hypothetical protein Z518_05348 [Rhinocladiella mackenziei CBS 650.93]